MNTSASVITKRHLEPHAGTFECHFYHEDLIISIIPKLLFKAAFCTTVIRTPTMCH